MIVVLQQSDFVNGKYTLPYGDGMEAQFTIVDEEFAGLNTLGRVNQITILVRSISDGIATSAQRQTGVIGMGNGIVGVRSSVPELRGKVLSKDNMSSCEILLYENGAV